MINTVRNTVLAISNKHNFGYISPSDFNLMSKQAQLEVFEEMFELLPREYFNQAGRTSGSGYADRVQAIIQEIESFSELDVMAPISGGYSMPSNCYYLSNVRRDGVNSDKVSIGKLLDLSSSNDTAPTVDNPMYSLIGSRIELLPTGATAVLAEYIRYPLDPKWTYSTIASGEALFDQSQPDYQDFELGLDYFPDLVMKILGYVGISIDRAEVVQYVQADEAIDLQQKA